MATEPQTNGWTQYQKLVLAELERHEKQMENVKRDILEIKLAQNKLSNDINSLQKSLDQLNIHLKDAANKQDEKNAAFDKKEEEKDKANIEQRIDIHDLKLKFGWLAAGIGLISGVGGSGLVEFIMRIFGH